MVGEAAGPRHPGKCQTRSTTRARPVRAPSFEHAREVARMPPPSRPATMAARPHPRVAMQAADPVHQRAQRCLPGFLAMAMSAFVAAVVTAINTGIDGGFALRWLLAWAIACPAAVAAAYLFRPLAWRAACVVSRWTLR